MKIDAKNQHENSSTTTLLLTMSGTNNKRKNEELESPSGDQLNKRVALDSEQLELLEKTEVQHQTAPIIGGGEDENIESTQQPEKSHTPEVQAIENTHESDYSRDTNAASSENFEITIENDGSKPVSNHREKESDPTYVLFRMYCPVKEASCIVGKKGEKINHIRDKANVRMNVSDNLKNIPERIILVRGPAENVARAFGLISRTILEEPEDEPASMLSRQYNLKILVPHPMIGFIIGKQGLKFREIEENSAAKLKAAEQPLPYSTDRILSITGVGDAIHIAIYYISQVMIEHKECLKKNKIIYYNPANFHHSNLSTSMMNISMLPPNNNMMVMGSPANPLTMQTMKDSPMLYQKQYGQPKQPYNFQMMFQPAIHPQQQYAMPQPAAPISVPPQSSYTDEHGNNIVGDVILSPPTPSGTNQDKFNQDIFVANANIGSVIGKGGNNIKHIRENSGCTYVKIEPDRGQSVMLGGGKGLTNIRKLTLTGSINSIQMATYLINQRIAADKERNA